MKRTNLRYNSLNRYLKDRFGEKVYKVSLDTGLTCPNRDGTKGTGGCIFCNPEAGTTLTSKRELFGSLEEQLSAGIDYVRGRHGSGRFIAYFQQYSNTYAPAKQLREWYNDAIRRDDVVGLAISTRPDCIAEDVYPLLAEMRDKTYLWVELGLQSAHDETLKKIRRGHDVAEFSEALRRLQELGIPVCAHMIIGLPGEGKKEVLETVKFLNDHKISGIKIHNLHVLKDTELANIYYRGEYKPLTLEEYGDLVIETLEHLSPEVLIHRFNGHSPRDLTIAPMWSINKLATLNYIEEELERRDTWQGKALNQ